MKQLNATKAIILCYKIWSDDGALPLIEQVAFVLKRYQRLQRLKQQVRMRHAAEHLLSSDVVYWLIGDRLFKALNNKKEILDSHNSFCIEDRKGFCRQSVAPVIND